MKETKNKHTMSQQEDTEEQKEAKPVDETPGDKEEILTTEIKAMNDKYLRLYAEFENYKKKVQKDKEELVKYANEKFIFELLPVLDSLEMAVEHARNEKNGGIVQGVDNTLKEFLRTLNKFGLTPIEAMGKPFDPSVHHAMSVVEREGVEENRVVEVFRKGYMLKDKVIRAPLVGVSKKPSDGKEEEIEIIEEES
ncbi:MAG TPA: nucleotide exchange factor GrpE [Thermodesulfovibrionales bacterium]|nr:nucleotide exchange factor GrpE [Thermodesulfovibrionales bacterium]